MKEQSTENDAPRSDPALLDAYRRQLAHMEPALVYLAWQGQEGITPDDLLDEFKRADASRVIPPAISEETT
jgi:hypothetical protein